MIHSEFTEAETIHINAVKSLLADELRVRFNQIDFPIPVGKMFLTGGAIASSLQGLHPNDYDIYFKDESTLGTIQGHYLLETDKVADVNENYQEYVGKDGKLITAHATTMFNKIQFITNISGSPEKIRDNFDYMHCKPYLDFDTGKLYISKQQYDACVQKRLLVNNPEVITIRRRDKFIQRGYYI